MGDILHFILNMNTSLPEFVGAHGWLIYPLLFLIIFLETGLVVTPFLPGDSIIFAASALCPVGKLNIFILMSTLIAAAIIGNTTNYFIGRALADLLKNKNKLRFIKRQHIKDAQHFFDKYGKKAIVITRFLPFVRTFTPFVAGASRMHWPDFMLYNCLGGIVWITLFSLLGYVFGNIPIVQEYYDMVIIGIVCITILPIAISKIISMVKRQKKLRDKQAGDNPADGEPVKNEQS